MRTKKLKIPTYYLTNPFYAYAISILTVVLFFSLRWSNYYRTLSDSVVIFLLLSSIIAIFIGKYSSLDRKLIFHAIPVSKHNKTVWYFIIVGYLLEFLYCRSIPIVSVVFNGMGNYRDFTGIPTFHVLLSTLSSFWGIYVFVQYQSNPDNKELKKYCGLAFIPHLLLLNRGALVHILLSDVFIYLIRKKYLSLKLIGKFLLGFLLFLFAFGFIGNIRDENSQTDSDYILKIGGATDEFVDSNIPESLYWGYMYIASPIGNLQDAITYSKPESDYGSFIAMLMECCLPDFISNRLTMLFPVKGKIDQESYMVTPIFNASTTYHLPYLRMGWIGVIWMFLFMIINILICEKMLYKSVYFLVGWSSLLSIITLNTFNNMWYYSGSIFLFVFAISSIKKLFHHARKDKQSVGISCGSNL